VFLVVEKWDGKKIIGYVFDGNLGEFFGDLV